MFSPDGRRLASASFDRTIKIWDVLTGRDVFTLRGHTSGILSLAFSLDGRLLTLEGSIRRHGSGTRHAYRRTDTRGRRPASTKERVLSARLTEARLDMTRAEKLAREGHWTRPPPSSAGPSCGNRTTIIFASTYHLSLLKPPEISKAMSELSTTRSQNSGVLPSLKDPIIVVGLCVFGPSYLPLRLRLRLLQATPKGQSEDFDRLGVESTISGASSTLPGRDEVQSATWISWWSMGAAMAPELGFRAMAHHRPGTRGCPALARQAPCLLVEHLIGILLGGRRGWDPPLRG